jgi:hypothetical protein
MMMPSGSDVIKNRPKVLEGVLDVDPERGVDRLRVKGLVVLGLDLPNLSVSLREERPNAGPT